MPPFIVDVCAEDIPFPFELNQNWNDYIEDIYELDKTLFAENCWELDEIISCAKPEPNQFYFTLNPKQHENSKYPKIVSYGGYEVHESYCEISVVGVSPQMQGKKFGEYTLLSLLMDACKKSVKTARLHVKADNEVAMKLYIKTGFEVIGLRRNYYLVDDEDESSSHDAYVMELNLDFFKLWKARETSKANIIKNL